MYKDVFDMAFRSGRGKIKNAFTRFKNSWKVLKCVYDNLYIIRCTNFRKFETFFKG